MVNRIDESVLLAGIVGDPFPIAVLGQSGTTVSRRRPLIKNLYFAKAGGVNYVEGSASVRYVLDGRHGYLTQRDQIERWAM